MILNLSAIQRLVDQVSQNNLEIQEQNGWREALGHDLIDNTRILNNINPDDLLEAVNCLKLVINPEERHDITKLLGIKRKTGRKGSLLFDETAGSEAMKVVYAYSIGLLSHSVAVKALLDFKNSTNADESAAKRFIAKHKNSESLLK